MNFATYQIMRAKGASWAVPSQYPRLPLNKLHLGMVTILNWNHNLHQHRKKTWIPSCGASYDVPPTNMMSKLPPLHNFIPIQTKNHYSSYLTSSPCSQQPTFPPSRINSMYFPLSKTQTPMTSSRGLPNKRHITAFSYAPHNLSNPWNPRYTY